MPTTLDPATALILIDLQHGITALPTVDPSDKIVARGAQLADAFRAHKKPVVATRVAFFPGRWRRSQNPDRRKRG